MAEIQQVVRDWLQTQPRWLQQAAATLLSSGKVSDADIADLVKLVKTGEAQDDGERPSFDELVPPATEATALRLVEVGDVRGIENLGPRIPLSFGNGNLCVVYGHNGSGKSGYARLLKRACGKPRASALKPNVFQPAPAERKCRINYRVTGLERDVEWPANGAAIDDLRSVDFFDTDTAVSYLTQESAASYIPPLVALFESLATACDQVRTVLQAEQERLVSALPSLPTEYSDTSVGVWYRSLTPTLDEPTIVDTLRWSDSDQRNLDQLTERLLTEDPAALARTKRNTKTQVEQFGRVLGEVGAGLSSERLAAVGELRSEALKKRRIATESAHVASAKLDGVGTETWRALWEAARTYSHSAYPGRNYPVTDEALCLLCHQPLSEEAQERLRDLEHFVLGALETEAKEAEQAHLHALDAIPRVLTDGENATWCHASGLTRGDWTERLAEYWRQAAGVRDAVLRGEGVEPGAGVAFPSGVLDELRVHSEQLERDITQHQADATHFDRALAGREKCDREARRWVAQQSNAVRAEILRLSESAAYDGWKDAASSRAVSIKAGEIAETVVSEAFVERFNRELRQLGALRIRVELINTRTEKGRALHRLRLRGAQEGQDPPEPVLSEGERRVVSLAACLADLGDQPQAAPFVFDDPISSLDHDFEWHVAVRLAQLAQTRQVMVFTHRLSLYGAMEDAAKKMGADWKSRQLHQCCIEAFAGTAGHPADQQTWNANTKKANNILLDRLIEAKRAGEASGADAYGRLAQGICSDLRKLVERTVEDDLLNEVVKRHRRSITTDNRLAPLPHITQDDCRFIDELMTKYSCYEHSQSTETPVFIPDEPELRRDLDSLKAWRDEFRGRGTAGSHV